MDIQEIQSYVRKNFSCFGVNKQSQIVKLLHDICRRDKLGFNGILPDHIIQSGDFFQIKAFLLKKRFPSLSDEELLHIPPLNNPVFSCDNEVSSPVEMPQFQRVLYEKGLENKPLLNRLKAKLPGIPFTDISSYRDIVKNQAFSISDYNRRCETLYIIHEKYDFFLPCPCSPTSLSCGYHIMNAGMGCGFDCVYCYLQGYVNAPGIVIPGNLDDILQRFTDYYHPQMRLGTGQFTDSLFLDDLTGFSRQIIEHFRAFSDVTFELKTKSRCVEGILSTPPAENIVISWSLNPRRIVEALEYRTATLAERIDAAHRCAQAGYRVGFHFDPIIYYSGWQEDYESVVDAIFRCIPEQRIAWISLGCLRMTWKIRQIMEARFPDTDLIFSDQIIGYDGKLRYPERIRRAIYQTMLAYIRHFSKDLCVYLCMEDALLTHELGLKPVAACEFSSKRN